MPKYPRPLSQPVEDLDRYEIITRAAKKFSGYSISKLVYEPGCHRIYGLVDCSLWAVVDRIDFDYFSQWKWSYARSPFGKLYISRRTTTGRSAVKKIDGFTVRQPGNAKTVYLHREIVLRRGLKPPTPDHKIIGHRNGNSLDCRRFNLKWTTYRENNTDQEGRLQGDEEDTA